MDAAFDIGANEAARLLRVSATTIYRMAECGRVPSFKHPLTHRRRFVLADLQRLATRQDRRTS
jgi:excisionase family DNA binding protein